MVTFGTNPGMGMPISGAIPNPASVSDPIEKSDLTKALKYMDLQPGKPLEGHPIDVVFIDRVGRVFLTPHQVAYTLNPRLPRLSFERIVSGDAGRAFLARRH